MNKAQLLEIISEKADLSQRQAKVILETILIEITQALKNGDSVQLVGFGTFKIHKRAERMGRNPKTGKKIHIASVRVPVFVSGKSLKTAVKQADIQEY
ncbi:HU family DNA-binding protein [Candidatus Erwinia haradaeae]|uniref:DNA-binding protein HU-alpha n=1 Tax=Candidatus Erwinia haradaeae TaxID=1922217 RepID=A0A451D9J5_9GAMM|nr:HU family DNA-binding protein [Candidatus Erwinia haradaeae]VFP82983.1 DNA-binding protein HU-alpha [Candidatus Erwinia haradaeae]